VDLQASDRRQEGDPASNATLWLACQQEHTIEPGFLWNKAIEVHAQAFELLRVKQSVQA